MAKNKALEQIEALAERLERAKEIVAAGVVEPIEGWDGAYVVTNGEGKKYLVSPDGCTCPDYTFRAEVTRGWCKHRIAAAIFEETARSADTEPLELAEVA